MLIPHTKATLLRKAEDPLFRQPEGPLNYRITVFWKLLRPTLKWLREELITKCNLEPEEADSEIYLFCATLFKGYNPDKSSIIPYLAKFIHLYKIKLINKLLKFNKEIPSGLLKYPEEFYWPVEEYYYSSPKILFEDKFIKNIFTLGEKCVINAIITSDDKELTQESLAKKCHVSRETMVFHLNEIANILKENS